MAITKKIEIDVDELKALGGLENLAKSLDKIDETQKQIGKTSEESLKKIEKGVDNTEKATKSLSSGFKGVGLAIKAMGIGLVLEAFNILKDLFKSNQVVADKFGTAFKALSIAFNDFFNFITKNAGAVTQFFKDIFENPLESLKSFGNLIKENIIERFNSVLEVSGFVADAFKKLFEGDFKGALDSVKEAGKEMVDVFTGVDDTVGKVGDLANAVSDYASEVWNSAEALQSQENNAKRAVAIQSGLVEQYDRQAEKLRQIRDNDLISINDRIKANNELEKVLNNQEKAMLVQAGLQVQAAANQYNLNRSIENEVALIEARNNVKAVEAQIEGFRSEQIANRIALEKESLDLLKAKQQTETELAINQKLFDAERLKDEDRKLQAQKEALENQKLLDLERLQSNIELYKEGTQARLDAESEYLLRKQELENSIIAKEDEIEANKLNKKLEQNQLLIDNEALTFENRYNLLNEREKLITEATALSEEERTKLLKDNSDARIEIQKRETEAKLMLMDAVSAGLSMASQELGEATIAGKAFAVASATISTYTAIAGQLQAFSKIPIPGYAIAQAIVTGATGLLQVKKILAVKTPKGGGGGGSAPSIGGAVGQANAPQFNVVGNTGVNQIAQSLGNQQPIQAYVVAGNVTTAQAMNRNIIQNATLG